MRYSLALSFSFLLLFAWETHGADPASVVRVQKLWALREAVTAARPGTRIEVAPGDYEGGIFAPNLRGEAGRPIVIAAADPHHPPVFKGPVQLADAAYVELHDLVFTGFAGNAIAIDDGGSYDTPAHHIVLRGVRVTDIGPKGNYHAVKYAGVDDFLITGCTFERWGIGAGLAIDAVGCHRGTIEDCTLRHDPDVKASGALGIQVKGGSRDIVIRRNRLENCGERGINIGGSTGRPYFRPALDHWPETEPRYEAKNITVEGNTIVGGNAALAFVNCDGAIVRLNTIYRPKRWAFRILQETTDPTFVPCRGGVFTDNNIVFRSTEWLEGGVNLGPKTEAKSFQFAHNLWFCQDKPQLSTPRLPVPEKGGLYGRDPEFAAPEKGDFTPKPNSPANLPPAHS